MRVSSLALLGLLAHVSAAAAADDIIERGKYLATAGDCMPCHSGAGAQPFSGGLALQTPFGTMISPNITPDQETGIGSWSDDKFYRSLHDGLGKDGENLYPAMPFTSYTKVTRDDAMAIKAYLFSLKPVHAQHEVNKLEFPFNIRSSLNVWRALFFKAGEFQPDSNASAEVNRGAYLVEGLAHCGECHTSRNAMGAKQNDQALAGAPINGWYTPNISGDMAGVGEWSDAQLVSYLKTGAAEGKGVAAGPMSEVVHDSLSQLTDGDIKAIVAYLKASPPKNVDQPATATAGSDSAPGAQAYLSHCASCHGADGKGIAGAVPALDGNGSVTSAGPENVIRVILGGMQAAGSYGRMPAIGAGVNDDQVAAIANYVRSAWSNKAAANAAPGDVSALRTTTPIALAGDQPSCVIGNEAGGQWASASPSDGVTPLLQGIDDVNMYDRVGEILAKQADASDPKQRAAIVNGLSGAYCGVLAKDGGISRAQQRARFDRFGQIVYSQLAATDDAKKKVN